MNHILSQSLFHIIHIRARAHCWPMLALFISLFLLFFLLSLFLLFVFIIKSCSPFFLRFKRNLVFPLISYGNFDTSPSSFSSSLSSSSSSSPSSSPFSSPHPSYSPSITTTNNISVSTHRSWRIVCQRKANSRGKVNSDRLPVLTTELWRTKSHPGRDGTATGPYIAVISDVHTSLLH